MANKFLDIVTSHRFLHAVVMIVTFQFMPLGTFADSASDKDIDTKYFADWFTLSDILASKGVQTINVSWAAIEPVCLPLKTSDNEIEYNKCRYNKALLERDFKNDVASCKKKPISKYPGTVTVYQPSQTIVVGNNTTNSTAATLSSTELTTLKEQAFEECMKESKWNNTKSWSDGKNQ